MTDDVRHFKLLQELGRGAAGVIHLALDVEHDELVAVKHLSQSAVSRHRNAVARFMREVKASLLHGPQLYQLRIVRFLLRSDWRVRADFLCHLLLPLLTAVVLPLPSQ